MNILSLETSTPVCQVALLRADHSVERIQCESNRHAEVILEMIQSVLQEASFNPSELDLIAYGQGPGSFTGLRIAASVAQGLALGWQCPTLGISSLWALASAALKQYPIYPLCYVVNDARLDEVYYAIYQFKNRQWEVIVADSVDQVSSLPLPPSAEACGWIGSGLQRLFDPLEDHFGAAFNPLVVDPIPQALDCAKLAKVEWMRRDRPAESLALPQYIRKKVTF